MSARPRHLGLEQVDVVLVRPQATHGYLDPALLVWKTRCTMKITHVRVHPGKNRVQALAYVLCCFFGLAPPCGSKWTEICETFVVEVADSV
jgi:hypothetical protein